MRRFEAEALSGTVGETMRSEIDACRRDGFEAHILLEELSNHAVHVRIGAALPGGVGMSKEEVSAEFPGEPHMLRKLFAVVSRERMHTGHLRSQL